MKLSSFSKQFCFLVSFLFSKKSVYFFSLYIKLLNCSFCFKCWLMSNRAFFYSFYVNGIDPLYISMRKINKSGILVAVVKWHHCENGFNVRNIFDMMLKWFYAWNKLKQQMNMTVIVHQTDLPCMGLQQIPSWRKTAENSLSITWGTWNWADTKRSCDIIFMKMKVIWFLLLGHILNKIIVIWFFKPPPFS